MKIMEKKDDGAKKVPATCPSGELTAMQGGIDDALATCPSGELTAMQGGAEKFSVFVKTLSGMSATVAHRSNCCID